MLAFKKYATIENSDNEKILTNLKKLGYFAENYLYTVQEKIHGSNFSIWINENEVKYAKRSAFLGKDSDFYNFQQVMMDFNGPIQLIQKDFINQPFHFEDGSTENIEQICIYGELCGGKYEGYTSQHRETKVVQKGIQYHPDNLFLAFDMTLNNKVIDYEKFLEILDQYQIPYIPSLFKGTLEDCLSYPNNFLTTLPSKYGLPDLEGNICEGVVIKSYTPIVNEDGMFHLMLKNKNEKWKEIEETANKKDKEKKLNLPDNLKAILDDLSRYITENRLNNVVGNYGPYKKNQFGLLLKEFTADIIKDYSKDSNSLKALSESDLQALNANLNKLSAQFISERFKDIAQG